MELQDQFHKDYPTQSAIDLGSVGYVGEESIYIREEQLDAAYHDSGIALDFYKSYNVSHYDPKKYLGGRILLFARYSSSALGSSVRPRNIHVPLVHFARNGFTPVLRYFDSLDAVPTSELKLCNTTDFSNPSRMNNYAKWSGDYEGGWLETGRC